MNTAKVENKANLVRDLGSNAILNTDVAALKAHLKQRSQLEKIDSLEDKIDSLETKMDMILKLLTDK